MANFALPFFSKNRKPAPQKSFNSFNQWGVLAALMRGQPYTPPPRKSSHSFGWGKNLRFNSTVGTTTQQSTTPVQPTMPSGVTTIQPQTQGNYRDRRAAWGSSISL